MFCLEGGGGRKKGKKEENQPTLWFTYSINRGFWQERCDI
jgi:hypothetical protein